MTEIVSLTAEVRQRAGKGGARSTRRAKRVPAVIYGNKQEPMPISLDLAELQKQLKSQGFLSRVFEIDVAGDKQRVLPREVQHHPITGMPLHVDFMRFGASTRIHVDVQVVFENETQCPGLKRGGVLNVVRHTVELVCRPDDIPNSVTVDLSGLNIGDVIHLDALKIPAGAEPAVIDPEATVATIAAPTVEVVEEEKPEEEGAAAQSAGTEAGGS